MAAKKRKGTLKKWILRALAIVTLGLVAMAAFPFFVPWNHLKDQATAFLSQALDRQVTIKHVSVGIWDGVSLEGISIANAPGLGTEPFFYSEKAILRPSLLSLLLGKLVVDRIEFKGPELHVVKDAKGNFNFSKSSDSSQKTKEGNAQPQPSSPSLAPPEIIINSFRISNGILSYRDMTTGKLAQYDGLNILLSFFSLSASGHSKLQADVNAEFQGKKIPVGLNADFGVDVAGQKIEIKSLEMKAPCVELHAAGEIGHVSSDPDFSLKAKVETQFENAVADWASPGLLASLPPGLRMEGGLTLNIAAKGRVSAILGMDYSGDLEFKNVGLDLGNLPVWNDMKGTLLFGPGHAQLSQLQFDLGGSPVSLALDASDYTLQNLAGPLNGLHLKLKYRAESPKLVLEPVFALAAFSGGAANHQEIGHEKGPSHQEGPTHGLVPRNVSIEGSTHADALQYGKILTGEFHHDLRLQQQHFKSEVKLAAFNGKFDGESQANFSTMAPKYSFSLDIADVKLDQAEQAFAATFPENQYLQQIRDKIFGSLHVKLEGHGRGIQNPQLLNELALEGNFDVHDGVLKKLDVEEKIAAGLPYPPAQEILRKDLSFDDMVGQVSVAQGKLTLNDFYLSSGKDHRQGDVYIQAHGTEWIGGALDYHIVPHFNPRAMAMGGLAAEAFNDDQGWPTFDDIEYKGPDAARANADYTQGLTKAASKILQNHLKQLPGALQNFFGK